MDKHEDYLAPCPNCGSKEVYIITEDEYIDIIKITFHCNNCNEELEVNFYTDITNKDIVCSCGKMFQVNKPKYPDCIGYGYTD